MTTEHTEHTDGTENRENWDMGQDREEFHHEGTKDTKGEDRPDLELIGLVGGSKRPGCATAIPDDVIRSAVEMIMRLQDWGHRMTSNALLAEARQNAALAERDQARVQKLDADKVAEELRDQVEALTAQLEEEERMVKRLREDVLGAPRGTVKVEEVQRYVGSRRIVASVPEDWPEETKVALVRLTPDGLGLAGTTKHTEHTEEGVKA